MGSLRPCPPAVVSRRVEPQVDRGGDFCAGAVPLRGDAPAATRAAGPIRQIQPNSGGNTITTAAAHAA
jgi:hypothetical protein